MRRSKPTNAGRRAPLAPITPDVVREKLREALSTGNWKMPTEKAIVTLAGTLAILQNTAQLSRTDWREYDEAVGAAVDSITEARRNILRLAVFLDRNLPGKPGVGWPPKIFVADGRIEFLMQAAKILEEIGASNHVRVGALWSNPQWGDSAKHMFGAFCWAMATTQARPIGRSHPGPATRFIAAMVPLVFGLTEAAVTPNAVATALKPASQ